VQPEEGNLDHPIYFYSHKLSQVERNHTTTEREGLAMMYSLQKFSHYLLGCHFKFFTNHSALKYLVNKPVLEGLICGWLLFFQAFSFKVIVKPSKLNVEPYHLSLLDSKESGGPIDDQLPYADMFCIKDIPDYFSNISLFLTTNTMSNGYSATYKSHLVVRATYYKLIAGKLYKLGLDNILWQCVLDHE